METVWKGFLSCQKWYKKVKGLDLPHMKLSWVHPPPPRASSMLKSHQKSPMLASHTVVFRKVSTSLTTSSWKAIPSVNGGLGEFANSQKFPFFFPQLLLFSALFALLFLIASGLIADILNDLYDAQWNKVSVLKKYSDVLTVCVVSKLIFLPDPSK